MPAPSHSPVFWDALQRSATLSELQQILGVSDEAIAGAAGKLRELKDEARRRSKLIQVCGREFDGSEDNLGCLWTHIREVLPDAAVVALSSIDLSKPSKLGSVARSHGTRGSGPGGGGAPGRHVSRPPKAIEMLIGVAGKIHAFRRLQAQYGPTVVTSSSWISRNSTLVFPENASFADDGKGCDFRFTAGDRMFYVEVKSSSGMDETFTLGSSEITLAMDFARAKRQRQKERFIVLRVLDALSVQPVVQVLPNPYDDRYENLFEIVEAGARVRYRVAV
jgi:hypothetical protein